MRAQEFVREENTLTIGPVKIVVDQHAIDRAQTRRVAPHKVDQVLRKLPGISDELGGIESGWRFWVFDPELNVALGLRRISSQELKFVLKTLWRGRPMEHNVAGILLV